MILNTKDLVIVKPEPLKKFTYGDQTTIPSPPHARLHHLLLDGEVMIIYPWEDHGPTNATGELNVFNYHSGVEIFAFNGSYQEFDSALDAARHDWLANVKDNITSNAASGMEPTEVYEFGLDPCEMDFLIYGQGERADWGIRQIPAEWNKTKTQKIQEANGVLAEWSLDEFPYVEVLYDEDGEIIYPDDTNPEEDHGALVI